MQSLKAFLVSSFISVSGFAQADEKIANPLHAQGADAETLFNGAASEITSVTGPSALYEMRDVDGYKCTKVFRISREPNEEGVPKIIGNPVVFCRK